MKAKLVRISHNKKTGPIPVSYSYKESCPDSCALKDKGCYADIGPVQLVWKRVSDSWEDFISDVRSLRRGTFWRHNVAGDLPGTNNTVDHHLLNQLVKANKGKQGFTFTHKPVGYSGQALVNARAIYAANKQGFTINLSAEGLKEADRLYDLSIAPVVVVVPSDAPKHMRTPKGRRVVTCPAEDSDMTCNDCRLCANSNRKGIVAFRAHGLRKNSINKLLKVIQ
jgi:hypothetical protein